MISLLSAFILIAGLASAQTADSTGHRAFSGRKMAMQRHSRAFGMQKLNLTADQKQQMKAANDDYRKQLAGLQNNNSITLGEYKTQLAALHKSHKDKVSSILTDEQKKAMAARRQDAQKRMHHAGEASLDKMKQNLNLSDDQVAKIKAQREDLHTKIKAIRENTSLLPEQKKSQVKDLFVQQKDNLKSVLTADQLSKLDAMRRQHMGHRGGFKQDAK